MSRIKEFYTKYVSKINVYWLFFIGFIALTFVAGDSNLYKRYMYNEQISSLEKEIKQYKDEIDMNKKKLSNLRTNKEGLERFAREEYLMKKANEDIFIIKDR
jgi:cell division protein FtsB